MTEAMNELIALNQFITSELIVRDLWDDSVLAGLYVVPLLAKFLLARSDKGEHDPSLHKQEICRIGALLYISGVRHSFGVMFSPIVYIPKIIDATSIQWDFRFESGDRVLRWVVFIGGIQSLHHIEHEWFVSAMAETIADQKWSTWAELMSSVREILWIEGILAEECHEFRKEVSAKFRNTYGRQLF